MSLGLRLLTLAGAGVNKLDDVCGSNIPFVDDDDEK
jgi:hypothetical protein